jgi:transposase
MDGSKVQPKMTAGLDLGDRYSYLCLIDTESGEVIEEGRLRTTPEAFGRRFASERPMRVAIEAGTHSPWASRVLEGCGHEVLVANSRKLRLIYSNRRKTDEVDAENLARLARVDPKLLHPLNHRGEGSQSSGLSSPIPYAKRPSGRDGTRDDAAYSCLLYVVATRYGCEG